MSIYDELRVKALREERLSGYIDRSPKKRGPAWNGAYAMPYNPFERALFRKRTRKHRDKVRRVGEIIK